MNAPKTLKKRPSEWGTPGVGASLSGLLVAFGMPLERALAISALVMSVAPGIISWWVDRMRAKA